MENKIELKNIYKKYDTFTLGELSLPIPKGFITGFIGRNGAGKTSTIKSILSLIKYDGEVRFNGEVINDNNYLQEVGVVMDDPFLGIDWSMALVNEAMKIGYDRWDEKSFYGYLDRFHIARKQKVKELSRGMKIKLMLAIALSHEAKLLILDEPTSGLDPGMRDEFTDILQVFMENEENTVLFSTHITQDLEAIADYIVFIQDGKLVSFETKDDFMDGYRVLKGDIKVLPEVDKSYIVGKKVNSMGFELLIKKENLDKIKVDFVQEKPTIDRIIALSGRE